MVGNEFGPAWIKAITHFSFYKQNGYCEKSYCTKTFRLPRYMSLIFAFTEQIKKFRWRVSLKNIEWNGNEIETYTCSLTVSYFLTVPFLPLGYLLTTNKGIQSAIGTLKTVISLTWLPRYNTEA